MISLVPQLLCLPARAGGGQGSPLCSERAPAFTQGCLSPSAAVAANAGLSCAVAVAEGGPCWLRGKERSQAGVGRSNAVCCVWTALMPEALTQMRLPKMSSQ